MAHASRYGQGGGDGHGGVPGRGALAEGADDSGEDAGNPTPLANLPSATLPPTPTPPPSRCKQTRTASAAKAARAAKKASKAAAAALRPVTLLLKAYECGGDAFDACEAGGLLLCRNMRFCRRAPPPPHTVPQRTPPYPPRAPV